MTNYRHLNDILGEEFDRDVIEHPAFAARIPRGAEVILQLADNPGFSAWQQRSASRTTSRGVPWYSSQSGSSGRNAPGWLRRA